MTRRLAVVAMMLVGMIATPAFARHQGSPGMFNEVTQYCGDRVCGYVAAVPKATVKPRTRGRRIVDPNANRATRASSARGDLVTVPTAAGISITVAREFEPKITGFIADLVARGYRPRKIHCFANGGHVRGSLHYAGKACDFDQRGWGATTKPMYHVASLAMKWGLRDGGEFRDWGHIDMGQHLRRRARVANLYEAVDHYHRKRGRIYR